MLFFKKKKEEERKISSKNYVILVIILVSTVLLGFYLYNSFKESDVNTSLMDNYIKLINYTEIKDYVTENRDVVIYSSVLKDKKIRNFEKNFRHVINKYELEDQIVYLNLTDLTLEERVDLSNTYNLDGKTIVDVPCLLIFKDGNLIDIYALKDNYNVDNLVTYLQKKEVINND